MSKLFKYNRELLSPSSSNSDYTTTFIMLHVFISFSHSLCQAVPYVNCKDETKSSHPQKHIKLKEIVDVCVNWFWFLHKTYIFLLLLKTLTLGLEAGLGDHAWWFMLKFRLTLSSFTVVWVWTYKIIFCIFLSSIYLFLSRDKVRKFQKLKFYCMFY